ncbi:411e570e-7846-4af9-920c-4ad94dccacf7 [Thermothielavioides terrestris]|jgi:hypothetical protein
MQY